MEGITIEKYVREQILPFVERSENNEHYMLPDPMPDYIRNSTLHSWYKHFRYTPGKLYPYIRLNPEARNMLEPNTEDNKLHWCFILEQNIFDKLNGYNKENLAWDLIKYRHIHLSHYYGGFVSDRPMHVFHANVMLSECMTIADHIIRVLLKIDPNPPTDQIVYCNSHLDPDLYDDETGFINNDLIKEVFENDETILKIKIGDHYYRYKWDHPHPDCTTYKSDSGSDSYSNSESLDKTK